MGVGAKGAESRTFGGAEVQLLRESGGEFRVGNVGEDVGDVTVLLSHHHPFRL